MSFSQLAWLVFIKPCSIVILKGIISPSIHRKNVRQNGKWSSEKTLHERETEERKMCSSQENSTQHLLLIPSMEAFDSHTHTLLHVLQMCDVQIHTSDDNDVDFGFSYYG